MTKTLIYFLICDVVMSSKYMVQYLSPVFKDHPLFPIENMVLANG